MNKEAIPRIYCDANFFIAFLKGKEIDKDGTNRSEICAQILNDAEGGKVEIYTSWCCLVECINPPAEDVKEATGIESAEDLFDYEYIIKSDVERFVAMEARAVYMKAMGTPEYREARNATQPDGKKIKKMRLMDAAHVATAILLQVEYLFTYDEDHILPLNGHTFVDGLRICKPCRPWAGLRDVPKTGLFADLSSETPERSWLRPPRRDITLEDDE